MAITYNRTNRSEHAWIDHPERMRLLEEYIGFTNIVVEVFDKKKGRVARKGITSSGLIIIRSVKEDKIITAYMPEEQEVIAVCRKAGKKCVPPKLMEKVRKNLARHPELLFMVA
jgi:hypothetical protein